mmetsp:Transcript_97516/g.232160  ORF Transcript_97516/g.232160 Transcript_97516/m.232160 type:complete len:211 (-) Transcript_97516:1187-1819(-)
MTPTRWQRNCNEGVSEPWPFIVARRQQSAGRLRMTSARTRFRWWQPRSLLAWASTSLMCAVWCTSECPAALKATCRSLAGLGAMASQEAAFCSSRRLIGKIESRCSCTRTFRHHSSGAWRGSSPPPSIAKAGAAAARSCSSTWGRSLSPAWPSNSSAAASSCPLAARLAFAALQPMGRCVGAVTTATLPPSTRRCTRKMFVRSLRTCCRS